MIETIEKLLHRMIFAHDKSLHFVYGFLMFFMIALFSPIAALIITITAAGIKELYDYKMPNHTSDYKDFIFTAIPAILGYILTLL